MNTKTSRLLSIFFIAALLLCMILVFAPEEEPDLWLSDLCKWDNVYHDNTFFGKLTTFFHSIFYFFANRFGLK